LSCRSRSTSRTGGRFPCHPGPKGIGQCFGATRPLDSVGFAVLGGKPIALVGENGAGTSTRRCGTIAVGIVDGLRAAACRRFRCAGQRIRPEPAVFAQPARGKGMRRGGRDAALAALLSAVLDALRPPFTEATWRCRSPPHARDRRSPRPLVAAAIVCSDLLSGENARRASPLPGRG
jgi:hypothetical protein